MTLTKAIAWTSSVAILGTLLSCSGSSKPAVVAATVQDVTVPETVRSSKVESDGRTKTITVFNDHGKYVLGCQTESIMRFGNNAQDTCIAPTPGKDYLLFTKASKWRFPGAKDYATLQFFEDFSGGYSKEETVALVPANADQNWGIYWLRSWEN